MFEATQPLMKNFCPISQAPVDQLRPKLHHIGRFGYILGIHLLITKNQFKDVFRVNFWVKNQIGHNYH